MRKYVNGVEVEMTPEEIAARIDDEEAWATIVSANLVLAVKAEANRRIEAIMPDYKQRNALALGVETVLEYGPDVANWPEDRQTENANIQGQWDRIKAIRAASDRIEGMDPIPADFAEREDLWK